MKLTGAGLAEANAKLMMKSKSNLGFELCCPHCGGNYLHHERVTVFARGEDDDVVLETTVRADRFRLPVCVPALSDQSANPSGRRHGLVILFSCEQCAETPELRMEQNKGQTFLSWKSFK